MSLFFLAVYILLIYLIATIVVIIFTKNIFAHRFNMYLKLFIVMGITWVLEIMSWIDIGADIVSQFIWYPADIVNALQGLIIFIIFVCRKKTLQTLLKQLDWKICDPFKIRTRCIVVSNTTTSTRRSETMPMQQIGRSN